MSAKPTDPTTREAWESGPPEGFGDDPEHPEPANDSHESGAVPRAEPAEPVDPPPPSPIAAPAEWFAVAPPPRVYLLRDPRRDKAPGFLPLGKVGQLAAEGGAGKTMALIQLAITVATGEPWLGTFTAPETGRVLLALGEEDADEARRRLYYASRAMDDGPDVPDDSIVVLPLAGEVCPMIVPDDRGNPVDGPFLTWFRDWATAHGPWKLIVVDPLSRFAGLEAEVSNAHATRFVQALESIAGATGATVLDAHHTNKVSRGGKAVGASAGRGSTALIDGARWGCTLATETIKGLEGEEKERLGELVTLTHAKSNYSRRAEPVLLRHDRDNMGALLPLGDDDLETVERARKETAAEDTPRQAARKADDADRTVREDEAVDRAVRERPGVSTRDLVTTVQAAARCGRDRAMVAVARAADRLDVRDGPRKARFYYPSATS